MATLHARLVREALGTAVLVLAGCGAIMVDARTQALGHLGVSLAFGAVVFLLVQAGAVLGPLHVNPAVTLGLWRRAETSPGHVVAIIAAQCVGAVVGSALLTWLLGDVGSAGATVPHVALERAFVIEAGWSALLALVILVATDAAAPPALAPAAIGGAVFLGALVTGPLTGGSFNPARSLGPAVASRAWTDHWIYWAAPVLGMALARALHAGVVRAGPVGVTAPAAASAGRRAA